MGGAGAWCRSEGGPPEGVAGADTDIINIIIIIIHHYLYHYPRAWRGRRHTPSPSRRGAACQGEAASAGWTSARVTVEGER